MKWRVIAVLMAGLSVAGCGGNPFNNAPDPGNGGGGGGGGGGGTGGVPEQFRGNLQSATYSTAGGGQLTVQIQPLDATPQSITFARNPTFDTQGYEAFTFQATNVNRFFVALFDTSADGAVTAGVAGSSQFTEMVWGSVYEADTAFAAPSGGGLASYSGNYAGILNTGFVVDGGLPPGPPFEPGRPPRVTGEVLINADFTDNAVEGGIRNRRVVDTNTPLDDVFLQITEVNADGTFAGTVVFDDLSSAGSYAGTFGGVGGTAVAGALDITPVPGNADLLERGVFVADRCVSGDPSPCPSTP